MQASISCFPKALDAPSTHMESALTNLGNQVLAKTCEANDANLCVVSPMVNTSHDSIYKGCEGYDQPLQS